MILIAHRGNINGPNKERENCPDYIRTALVLGYEVEIDVWYKDNQWLLGHDAPQYQTSIEFLSTSGLWLHCKHYESLQQLARYHPNVNFFYHTDEDYVLTSHLYIWGYPGQPGNSRTICVMPELNNQNIIGFDGVCSDYVEQYL